MMFRRTMMSFAGAALAATLLTTTAMAQDVTLRMHQFLPPQANVPKLVLDVWADSVEAASDGRIKVERYPAMQLGGKPPELMDQAIDGVADIVWTVVGYTPGRYPRTEVFELPFMMTDARSMSAAYWQMFEKHMEQTEFADLKILGTWVHGPGIIHANKEIRTPADMAGMKVRGGSRLASKLIETLGGTPVGMPVPAVPEGLSKGVIDGTTIPWEVTPALKVPELVGHHTEFTGNALYTLTFVLAMNKDRYEGLSDADKAVIDANSGLEFSVFAGGVMEDMDVPSRAIAADRGNAIVTLSAEETEAWKAAAQPVIDGWLADMESQGIDGQALIDEAKQLIADYKG